MFASFKIIRCQTIRVCLVVLLFTANCTLNFDEVNNICLEESPPRARGKSFLTCGNRSLASRQSVLECKATAPLPLGNNGTHALSGIVLHEEGRI